MVNIWERPPIPDQGDPTAEQIYTAVGFALSGWELLETELAGLFDILIGIDLDSHASHRAYGAVTAWNIRRDMLRAAAEAYFIEFPNESLEWQLGTLINYADQGAPRRNDIAHGIVGGGELFYFTGMHPKGKFDGYLLFPAYTSTKSMRLPFSNPKYAFNGEIVSNFGRKFRNLRPIAAGLITEIRKRSKTGTSRHSEPPSRSPEEH